jgi:hypothetical protein
MLQQAQRLDVDFFGPIEPHDASKSQQWKACAVEKALGGRLGLIDQNRLGEKHKCNPNPESVTHLAHIENIETAE